jgi:hypothetical protein
VQLCDEDERKMIIFFIFPSNGASVEWNWQEKTEVLGENLSQCHIVHYKSQMNWPGIEPVPPRWNSGDQPPEPWHGLLVFLHSDVEYLVRRLSFPFCVLIQISKLYKITSVALTLQPYTLVRSLPLPWMLHIW